LVIGARDEIDGVGVTEDATFGDRVSEIEHAFGFVAWSDVPSSGLRIIGDGRLKEVGRDGNEIAETDFAGTYGEGDGVFGGEAAGGETVGHDASGIVADGDVGIRGGVVKMTVGLGGKRAERTGHGVAGEGIDFGGVAGGAGVLGRGEGQGEKGEEWGKTRH
jgi:hypothetical protein